MLSIISLFTILSGQRIIRILIQERLYFQNSIIYIQTFYSSIIQRFVRSLKSSSNFNQKKRDSKLERYLIDSLGFIASSNFFNTVLYINIIKNDSFLNSRTSYKVFYFLIAIQQGPLVQLNSRIESFLLISIILAHSPNQLTVLLYRLTRNSF